MNYDTKKRGVTLTELTRKKKIRFFARIHISESCYLYNEKKQQKCEEVFTNENFKKLEEGSRNIDGGRHAVWQFDSAGHGAWPWKRSS